MKDPYLRAVPNPFAYLDHDGLPAGTYAFDPDHGQGSRRWVGATVDRSLGPDGQPKTRALPQDGDKTAAYRPNGPDGKPLTDASGRPVVRRVTVDRAPMKRIVWAHAVDEAHPLPDTPHYRLGFREGSLIPANEATAKKLGVPFVPVADALAQAAKKAIDHWTQTYGEPPDVDAWPENLRRAAGLEPPPPAQAPAREPPAALPAHDPPVPDVPPQPALPAAKTGAAA